MKGRKPKPKGTAVNRSPSVHDWTDVVDVPYDGDRPSLPKGTPAETGRWWDAVSRMPHCVLWSPTDWQFALDTSRVHAAFVGGDLARAAELRIRESHMGTTMDALRDLRIRYVDESEDDSGSSDVSNIDDVRRRRVLDAG